MKRTALALAIILALLSSVSAGIFFLKVAEANFYPQDFRVIIESPINKTYTESTVSLNIITTIQSDFLGPEKWIGYSLDGQETVTVVPYIKNEKNFGEFVANATLNVLSNGQHSLTVYAENRYNSKKMPNITLSANSTVYFSVNTTPSPEPQISESFPVTYSMSIVAVIVLVLLGSIVYILKRKR